jgi:hypothetical protein
LHFLDLIQPVPLLHAAPHFPPRPLRALLKVLALQSQFPQRYFLEILQFGPLGVNSEWRETLNVLAGREGRNGRVSRRKISAGTLRIENFLGGKAVAIQAELLIGLLIDFLVLLVYSLIFLFIKVESVVVIFNNCSPLQFLEHLLLDEDSGGGKVDGEDGVVFVFEGWVVLHDLAVMK